MMNKKLAENWAQCCDEHKTCTHHKNRRNVMNKTKLAENWAQCYVEHKTTTHQKLPKTRLNAMMNTKQPHILKIAENRDQCHDEHRHRVPTPRRDSISRHIYSVPLTRVDSFTYIDPSTRICFDFLHNFSHKFSKSIFSKSILRLFFKKIANIFAQKR
jgi:hypothetical protein